MGFVLLSDNDKDKDKPLTGSGRLLVYGNADNNDYLDQRDVDMIRSIIDSGTWNKKKYPLADANHDGKVDESDVTHLEALLEGKKRTKMWYIGSGKVDYYVNYPNEGNIAVTVDYGLMLGQIFGVYDRITAGTSKCLTYNTDRYPGVDKLTDLGTYSRTDFTVFQENLMATDCTIVLGYIAPALYDSLRNSGKDIDQINLSASAQTAYADMDVVCSILTCGVLLGKGDEARKYCRFADEMKEKFAEKASAMNKATFLVAYNTNNPTTTWVDNHYLTGGAFGDVWTLSHLPMRDIVTPTANGMTEMSIESICSDIDPDIIIISLWGAAADKDDPKTVQALVDQKAAYFRTSNAYKNGDVYAVNYESIGTYMGLGALGVMGAYIWPEEYDLNDGWDTFYRFIKEFTYLNVNSVDELKECGGMIVYKMTVAA